MTKVQKLINAFDEYLVLVNGEISNTESHIFKDNPNNIAVYLRYVDSDGCGFDVEFTEDNLDGATIVFNDDQTVSHFVIKDSNEDRNIIRFLENETINPLA